MANGLQGYPNPKSLHSVVFEASNLDIFQGQAHFFWRFQLSSKQIHWLGQRQVSRFVPTA